MVDCRVYAGITVLLLAGWSTMFATLSRTVGFFLAPVFRAWELRVGSEGLVPADGLITGPFHMLLR